MLDYIDSLTERLDGYIKRGLSEIYGKSNSPITMRLCNDFSISDYLGKIDQYEFVYSDKVNDMIGLLLIDAIRNEIEECIITSIGSNICITNIKYIVAKYLTLDDINRRTVRYGHCKTLDIRSQLTLSNIADIIYEVGSIVHSVVYNIMKRMPRSSDIFYHDIIGPMYLMKSYFIAYDPLQSLYPDNRSKREEISNRLEFPSLETFFTADIDTMSKEEYSKFTKNLTAVVAISVSKFLSTILYYCDVNSNISGNVFYIPSLYYVCDMFGIDNPDHIGASFRMLMKYYDRLGNRGLSSYEIVYTDGHIAIPFNISVQDFIHMVHSVDNDLEVIERVAKETNAVLDMLSGVLIN